jgi:hypothetical protein
MEIRRLLTVGGVFIAHRIADGDIRTLHFRAISDRVPVTSGSQRSNANVKHKPLQSSLLFFWDQGSGTTSSNFFPETLGNVFGPRNRCSEQSFKKLTRFQEKCVPGVPKYHIAPPGAPGREPNRG